MSTLGSAQPAAVAARAAEALAQVEWDQVEPSELPEAAALLARAKAQLEAALLLVAERIEETDASAGAGWASAKDFLTHVTGGRKGTGGTLLRIARQTAGLPCVREALAEGSMSAAQASVIGARASTLPHDLREQAAIRMVELATEEAYDASDLDRAFPGLVRDELDPEGRLRASQAEQDKADRAAHHARFLSFAPDILGGVRIKGYATIEDTELIKTTLMPLAAPAMTEPGACGGDPAVPRRDDDGRRIASNCPDPACAHDGRDPRDHGARMLDALVEACHLLQASDELPRAHGTAARITVTLPYEQLLDQASGAGLLGSGESLSAAAVRRLACDAEIIPAVLGSDGQVLDVGRLQRLVTSAIWLALVLRDQHCAFPGCTRLPIACDAHHVEHWADGGATSLDNLVLLCRRHHVLVHQSPWDVHLDPTTRRPVWSPPPPVDDRDRFTYLPTGRPPPLVA